MKGGFITFEGIDGCGKTTQSQMLAEKLTRLGWQVTLTREPGGTPVGRSLRAMCLEGKDAFTWETEMLLMAADRAQHVAEVIKPDLLAGKFVICDRYIDSSLAYQGYGAEQSVENVLAVNAIATQGLLPDLTILLAVAPEDRYQRPGQADRIESREVAYHQRVYQGFLQIAKDSPRMVVLSVVGLSQDQVAERIWQTCLKRLAQLRT